MKIYPFLVLFCLPTVYINAQDDMVSQTKLPYYEIPAYPDAYTAGTVAARMIDGLGYRYHWATEGLKAEDLAYKPSEDGRATEATLFHIYGLSQTILNAVQQQPNIRPSQREELGFDELRKKTLENFQKASTLLKDDKDNLEDFPIIFQRGENKVDFPFWNLINGPIADAIYHVGQVVSFRRSSGNPMNPNTNVFIGKTRD